MQRCLSVVKQYLCLTYLLISYVVLEWFRFKFKPYKRSVVSNKDHNNMKNFSVFRLYTRQIWRSKRKVPGCILNTK